MKSTLKIALLILAVMVCSCKSMSRATKTTSVHDTTIVHVVKFDTVVIQIADTSYEAGLDILQQTSTIDYAKLLDSMQLANALKDDQIKSLLSQILNRELHFDAIQTSSGSANAVAGVDNNKLWLKLSTDSIGIVTSSTDKTVTINNTEVIEHNNELEAKHAKNSGLTIQLIIVAICLFLLYLIVRTMFKK